MVAQSSFHSLFCRAGAAGNQQAAVVGGQDVYPALNMIVTIPKFTPTPFKKYANDYMRRLVATLSKNKVKVSIMGLQGEDGGCGVHTKVIFLSGGSAAATDFRSKLIKFGEGNKIWPAAKYGDGVHLEGISQVCLSKANGNDAQTAPGISPTLVAALALPDRSQAWLTPARKTQFLSAIKAAMKPDRPFVSADTMIDDNDESSGFKTKTVFNVMIQGPTLARLEAFNAKLKKEMKGFNSTGIFPASLGFGHVHIEGGSALPTVCMMETATGTRRLRPIINDITYVLKSTTAKMEVEAPSQAPNGTWFIDCNANAVSGPQVNQKIAGTKGASTYVW
jgi:hypothetical protein